MRAAFRLLLFPLMLVISACVMPVKLAEEKPFGDKIIGFIRPGVTPKAEIEDKLGVDYMESDGGAWWAFDADRTMSEWIWFFCGGGGSLGAPVGCEGGDFGGKQRRYSLVLRFDEQGIVRNAVVVSDRNPCTADKTLCYEGGAIIGPALSNPDGRTGESPMRLRPHVADPWDQSGTPVVVLADPDYEAELIDRRGWMFEAGSVRPFTGHVVLMNRSGIKETERTYDDGKLNGVETFFYPTGEVAYQASYIDNTLHGPMTFWQRDGAMSSYLCYDNGLIVDLALDQCDP